MKIYKYHFGQTDRRNSNVEILRIIAMLMIVASHYAIFTNLDPDSMPFSFNKLLLDSMGIGKLGVAIFVMITGYYMSNSLFRIQRIVNIELQTLFYSISIFLIFCIEDHSLFSLGNVVKNFFPVITQRYWFISAYVILCFFIPFLNRMINNLERKECAYLLAILIFFYSVAPTFLNFDAYSFGGHISYMIMFYCVGVYVRKYPDNSLSKGKRPIILAGILVFIMFASVVCIDILAQKYDMFQGKSGKFYTVYSTVVLVIAVCLLILFTRMKIKYNSLINIIGSCTLGVYLIHENNFMRTWLWETIFDNSGYQESKLLILHFVGSVIIVYSVCTGIEYIRKYILERIVFRKFYVECYKAVDRILLFVKRMIEVFLK